MDAKSITKDGEWHKVSLGQADTCVEVQASEA